MSTETLTTFSITSLIAGETTLAVAAAIEALSESDKMVLLEAFLSGNIVTKGDQVVTKPIRETGPRGPTDKVKPRLETCRAQILSMIGQGLTISATDLLDVAEKRYVYTDIGVVVDQLLSEGVIVQSNKGRKLFWSKV